MKGAKKRLKFAYFEGIHNFYFSYNFDAFFLLIYCEKVFMWYSSGFLNLILVTVFECNSIRYQNICSSS